MNTYPKDWPKIKSSRKNKLGYMCEICCIPLSQDAYHHWEGKRRKDSIFLHTHYTKASSKGGKKPYNKSMLLCAGCHSYQRDHEHMRENHSVKEFYSIFLLFYFNKKRPWLFEKMVGNNNIDRVKSILPLIKPHNVHIDEFEEDFDTLVNICKKQLSKNKSEFDFTSEAQGLIMTQFYNGWNTFGILPTGSGKSLCFTAVAKAVESEGITVIISPLISLMKDMKRRFKKCEFYNSSLNKKQKQSVLKQIRNKKRTLLLISPERLKIDDFKKLLEQITIARFVIDEAHCIADWGYGFRIKYLRIIDFLKSYSTKHKRQLPILLLTATVTEKSIKKILDSLELDKNKVAIVPPPSLKRDNLNYILTRCENDSDKLRKLKQELRKTKNKKGIVFSLFANRGENIQDSYDAESICEELSDLEKVEVKPYHSKLSPDERKSNQEWFAKPAGKIKKVLVATSAFGMGMDIPDIRFIFHFYPPQSMESYWQETGRAGRDGDESDCVLFYASGDFERINMFGILPRFEKFVMIYEAIVNGVIYLPKKLELNNHKNFNNFIYEMESCGILVRKSIKKNILGEQYTGFTIKKNITESKLKKMWSIVSLYPNAFHGYKYKRITSLIEIYVKRHKRGGTIHFSIPNIKGGNVRHLSQTSVIKDLNVFLQLGSMTMDNSTATMDQFCLVDSDYSNADYKSLREWLDERRTETDETKELISDMLRKKNLTAYVENFWENELTNLNKM